MPRTALGREPKPASAAQGEMLSATDLRRKPSSVFLRTPPLTRPYKGQFTADYRPRTNFELELVARLVSLLWRLRRAVAIESGLLNIHAEIIGKRKDAATTDRLDVFYRLIRPLTPAVQNDGDQRRFELDDTSNPSQAGQLSNLVSPILVLRGRFCGSPAPMARVSSGLAAMK